ncbi:GDSL lipase/esterase [Dillenia turbinata]|uniref:GDSL lipase/esterase n=1 Tax=Dillenia turbinata TaxID=194707 RepID=A0AAN8UIH2_9MAGN
MERKCFSFLISSLILCLVFTPSFCLNDSKQKEKRAVFFLFGDSLLDAGNNNYINTTTLDQANFWPYGETYFKVPTGRFCDGRLLSDFIAEYANLPLIPPVLQPGKSNFYYGANFASAGAGALVETFQGAVINLKTQLKYFMKIKARLRHYLGYIKAETTLAKGVYLFSIGTNDYMNPFLTNSSVLDHYSKSQYVGMVIGNLSTALMEIYKSGGRKFGFLNLGDLGCLPGLRILIPENKSGCLEEVTMLAKLHNKALAKLLLTLESHLVGFKYSYYNFNDDLRDRTIRPSRYGFREGKAACCGTGKYRGVFSCGGRRLVQEFQLCEHPKQYVFWDSYHLTETANEQLADQMWKGSRYIVGPYNLKQLFQDL